MLEKEVERKLNREAERYIRDFRLWTSSSGDGLLIEISAVNGRFTLDFLQTFSNPAFVNAFLHELDQNGIVYDLQDVNEFGASQYCASLDKVTNSSFEDGINEADHKQGI